MGAPEPANGSFDPASTLVSTALEARTLDDFAVAAPAVARALSGADGATLVLREGGFCRYVGEHAIQPLWTGMRFPVSSCVPGWAMTDGQTVIIADVLNDQRTPRNLYHPTFVRALAMTPIGTRPCAVIGAYWAAVGRPPRAAIDALKAFADSVATLLPRLIEAARR